MKAILTTLIFGLFLSLNAQETILDIKSNSSEIIGSMSNSFYKHDIPQFKDLRNILNLDVFEYFGIKSKYDTDLKKKVFKESEDYKTKYSELLKLRTLLISKTYYLDFEPSYYERNNQIKYNLNNKTFTVTNQIYYTANYNKPEYFQFTQIVFKCLIGLSVKKNYQTYGGVEYMQEAISFIIENESLALKIEENKSNLKLLFIFNVTGTSPFQDNVLGLTTYTNYHLLTILKKVVVYNSETNEIYFTYKL